MRIVGSYFILPFLLLPTVRIEAEPSPITVTARYRLGFAPADFPIKIRIEPHPDNRKVCWEYDGGDYSRSCRDVEGDKGNATRTIWLKGISEGEYVLTATLTRIGGKTFRSSLRFRVLARGATPSLEGLDLPEG